MNVVNAREPLDLMPRGKLDAELEFARQHPPAVAMTVNRQLRMFAQLCHGGRADVIQADHHSCTAARQHLIVMAQHHVFFGGQFEAQEKASQQITLLSLIAIGGIFLLLYIALRTARAPMLVMANLPLSLIGGVVMVFEALQFVGL